jgi:two-component system chemotaxis response regulator CheY
MSATASQPVKLPAVLDFAAAESFLQTMTGCVKQANGVRLDASEVRTLTFSCVQILLAAIKDCGDRVVIERPSDEFLRTFNDLALDKMIAGNVSHNAEQATQPAEMPPAPTFVAAAEMPAPAQADTPAPVAAEAPAPAAETAAEAPLPHAPVAEQKSATDDFEETVAAQRILTIDDSRTIRDMLMLTLSGAGFNVSQAVDGQEGIDILEKETFDVVITDINMPKKDGYDVIRAMRANPMHNGIPILVLTTEADTEKRQIAREAGATGWMVKPFDPERLLATVRKVAP